MKLTSIISLAFVSIATAWPSPACIQVPGKDLDCACDRYLELTDDTGCRSDPLYPDWVCLCDDWDWARKYEKAIEEKCEDGGYLETYVFQCGGVTTSPKPQPSIHPWVRPCPAEVFRGLRNNTKCADKELNMNMGTCLCKDKVLARNLYHAVSKECGWTAAVDGYDLYASMCDDGDIIERPIDRVD